VTLTSSNRGWHKGWFYLRNDAEFALPSHWELHRGVQRSWADGPTKKEQEKIIKNHWAVLGHL
jgi:hypothetical protein